MTTKKACCTAEAFWQQEIAENTSIRKLFTKRGQWSCCLMLGIVCVGLGGALLAETNKVQEEVLEYGTSDKSKEFTIKEDMTSDVFFYYGLDNFYGNYRNFVENREDKVVPSTLMRYKCNQALTIDDAERMRTSPQNFEDIGKYLTPDALHPGNIDSVTGEQQEMYPCGLVALSMFLDEYSLYKVAGEGEFQEVALNTSGIAWESDMKIFNEEFLPNAETGELMIDDKKSWIKTPLMIERFAVWYRTSASTKVRHLWAKIPGGLTKGKYKITFNVNGPIWDVWGVKKSVVLSTVSSTGGKNEFLGITCIIWGIVLLLSGLVWLAAPTPVKQVATEEEDGQSSASDPSWAAPR